MAKSKKETMFVCTECGDESPIWQGKCKSCGAWNTYKEIKIENILEEKIDYVTSDIKKTKLKDIVFTKKERVKSSIDEFDKTIGGGLVPGQVILIGGNPGIGKSTLVMQICANIDARTLYVSGEESEEQIAMRANRLGVEGEKMEIVSTNNLASALNDLGDTELLIIDSIQTILMPNITGSAGSVSQIKECAYRLVTVAKTKNIPVIIIGHITKEGSLAGPKILEHMVDTVLYLEGGKESLFRFLRVFKNRFGDDTEVGIFEMKTEGMVGVKNSGFLLNADFQFSASGNTVSIAMEGKRPIAVEVQALVTKSAFGFPKRTASGYSLSRLQLLAAVLEKRLRLPLNEYDIYLNIASGFQTKDPSIDLPVCVSIISSVYDKPVKDKSAFFGEVGLSGEVRRVIATEQRIKEAKNLGFNFIGSQSNIENIQQLKGFLMI
ncbi:MAG: DNA repair protein RadA [Niabella sp.]|nr:MAG: DNA repair protein RadA [Niabella sp.]